MQYQRTIKRVVDIAGSLTGLLLLGWVIALAAVLARIETKKSGIYRQQRIGLHGKLITVYKIRTMQELPGVMTHVTRKNDPRITRFGHFFRQIKIDELPQLVNVLKGDMSLVGPRPDVPEIAWRLLKEAPLVLTVRPGITGPASLKYRNEEEILESCADPEWVNEAILFPDKMRINTAYVRDYSWQHDLKYLWRTFAGTGERASAGDIIMQIANLDRVA